MLKERVINENFLKNITGVGSIIRSNVSIQRKPIIKFDVFGKLAYKELLTGSLII
ncbi:MAG: hypothetical protein QG618_455 [Thermodesulfobacteriota bacterium]|nr:hypothetical protein [Thermodesulfobacteriota bacterium]